MTYILNFQGSSLPVCSVPDNEVWSGSFIAKLKDSEGDAFKLLTEDLDYSVQNGTVTIDGLEYVAAFALSRRTTVMCTSLIANHYLPPYSLTGKITDERFKPF